MREIKFRLWDTLNKEMTPFGLFERPTTPYWKNCVVMQYTWRKDKNGKEIYEGDIVLTHATKAWPDDDNVYACIQQEEDGQFQTVKKGQLGGVPITWGGYTSLEVIGNIYENPELLSESDFRASF